MVCRSVSSLSLFLTLYDGNRYFLRENMPRIQYNNPAIQFDVQKVQQPGVSPELTIEFGKELILLSHSGYRETSPLIKV